MVIEPPAAGVTIEPDRELAVQPSPYAGLFAMLAGIGSARIESACTPETGSTDTLNGSLPELSDWSPKYVSYWKRPQLVCSPGHDACEDRVRVWVLCQNVRLKPRVS